MSLVASRITLIQLESKDAARGIVRSAALILAACGCVFFSWALVLAGGISLVAQLANWPWNYVALAVATVHLLAGLIMARLAIKSPRGAMFPITRAEFQKDREWIEKFSKNAEIERLIQLSDSARSCLENEAAALKQRLDVPARIRGGKPLIWPG